MGCLKKYVMICGSVLGLVNIFFLPSRRKHEMFVKFLECQAVTGFWHLITQERLGTRITLKKEISLAPR